MAFDIQTATDDELNNEITTLVHAWCYGAKRADLVKLYHFLQGVSYIPRLPKNVPLSKRSVRFDGQKQIGAGSSIRLH